jgi:arylsulfatase A-like enzyme
MRDKRSHYIEYLTAVLAATLLTTFAISRVCAADVASSGEKPNILFIEVDDLTYSYLGCMGNQFVRTPNIDSLARRGVLFKNAVCQGMMCGPSRNGLITGLYPHNLGFYRNGQMKQLPQGIWTLPKALQRSGYYTAWIGKSHIRPFEAKSNPKAMETEMGFNFVQKTLGRAMLGGGRGKGSTDWYYQHLKEKGLFETFKAEFPKPSTLPEDDYLDGLFTKSAIDFLNSYHDAEEKPFFLWLNYSLPHGPHDVNQAYLDLFSAADMPGSTKAEYEPPEKLVADTRLARSEEKTKQTQAAYCGAVAFLDRQVGRVLKALEQEDLLQETVVVFFSDHGIMMGHHGRFHKGTLFRQVTNPALIISWPKQFQQDTIVASPVELADILKTSLELAHASDEDKQSAQRHSLLPLLTGNGDYGRRAAFAEIEGYVVVVCDGYRYIQGVDASLLFSETADPNNLVDLSEKEPERVVLMSKYIMDWLEKTGPVLPKNSH